MSKLPDRAAAIAAFFCETPPQMLGGGGVLTMESIQAELDRRFPGISFDEAIRAHAIAQELKEADLRFKRHMGRLNNPCKCGEPGDVIVYAGVNPTGERRCFACDLADAAKTPCAKCGGAMNGEDIRAGFALCVACEPDDIDRLDRLCDDGGAE